MDEVKKLNAMLAGLGKSQLLWNRQVQELETLRSQVSMLQHSASSDPVAGRKLANLNDYMSREGNHVQRQIVEKLVIADKNFKELDEQLRALTNAPQEGVGRQVVAPLKKAVKNNSRDFA